MEYTISEESLEKLYKQIDKQAATIARLTENLENANTAATSLQIQNAKLIGKNARLTAAHEMQDESLVVLPRWMVENMADRTEAINSAIEDIKYYVANPSAWEHYDDGVSEKIRAILKAAGMA